MDCLASAIKVYGEEGNCIWGYMGYLVYEGRKSDLQLQLIFACYSTEGKADIIISGSPKWNLGCVQFEREQKLPLYSYVTYYSLKQCLEVFYLMTAYSFCKYD